MSTLIIELHYGLLFLSSDFPFSFSLWREASERERKLTSSSGSAVIHIQLCCNSAHLRSSGSLITRSAAAFLLQFYVKISLCRGSTIDTIGNNLDCMKGNDLPSVCWHAIGAVRPPPSRESDTHSFSQNPSLIIKKLFLLYFHGQFTLILYFWAMGGGKTRTTLHYNLITFRTGLKRQWKFSRETADR